MNHKRIHLVYGSTVLALLLLISSCSSVKVVSTHTSDNFRLSNYNTFDFYRLDVDAPMHPEYRQRMDWIRDAVSDYLEGRGLSYSDDNPEMIVNIGIAVQEVEETLLAQSDNQSLFVGTQDYENPFQQEIVDRYDEGTVTVDFVDLAKNSLVWRGIVQAVMAPTEEGSRENIADGVKKMSDKIP